MSPIRVDFYLLAQTHAQAPWLLACRLLEKAYHKGHQVYVLCEHQSDAELLDELLWTFKKESFVPHCLQDEAQVTSPIQIAYDPKPQGFHDILLNMSNSVPPFFKQFQRIIELVKPVESEKKQSRIHYKAYQSQGCELHSHRLDARMDPSPFTA